MNSGKQKCEILRHIRMDIAERYGLKYNPTECIHEGDCSGTCPKCDAELKDLQLQLDARGITEIDLTKIPIVHADNGDIHILEGDAAAPFEERLVIITEGMPSPPNIYKEKKRVLYKECKISGITFHDLNDVWDDLYEGAELALVREKDNKHDKYAIAVALADDYEGDPDDFDFENILGYVPRTENQHLATMMDLGWSEVFECELSQVNGSNPYKGSLYMKIYMVSKDEHEIKDTTRFIRVLELNEDEYKNFTRDLGTKGCTYFRFGGFPLWEHNLPKKGESVVFMHKEEQTTILYLMHCIAVGDDEATYFIEDKESLFAIDDCSYYVFTNTKGPIKVQNEKLHFLQSETINRGEPKTFLSEGASFLLKSLISKA